MKSWTDDRSYHQDRMLAELRLAEQASDPSIAMVHRELAALHRRRVAEITHLGEPQIGPAPLLGRRPLQADIS